MLWTLAAALALAPHALATSITDCHAHGSAYYCVNTDGQEGSVIPTPTGSNSPQSYTSCHNHGTETYCMSGADEVLFAADVATSSNSNAAASGSITSVAAQTTAITDCHLHGLTQYCVDGEGNEGYISPLATNTADLPLRYTSCHAHETDTFCMSGSDEVQFMVDATGESELSTTSSSSSGQNCHFHAGVEHCVGSDGEESETSCERVDRDYNIPVRIGTLFAILATSSIGVFLPMICSGVMKASMDGTIITVLTQFGTGVILATALVHLTTHAQLMFANDCITLHYESAATSIIMAGLFIGFLADFASTRVMLARRNAIESGMDQNSNNSRENEISDVDDKEAPHTHSHGEVAVLQDGSLDKVSVLMLEAGIIFHSVLIGVTTVVAGDSYYITLFIVVIFHQAFEGVALGSRIAKLTNASVWTKIFMGSCYAITTPLGMGIGIGVLQHWNGNDPSTVIAVGTLDSFSAGILLWVGLIEMLAHDWLHGPLSRAGFLKTALAMAALVAGMILMSFLGKWT